MPKQKRKVDWCREDWTLFIQMYRKHECLWNKKISPSQEQIKEALLNLKEYFRINIQDLTITDIKMRIKQVNTKYAIEKKRVEFLKKNNIPVFLKPWFRVADEFLCDDPKKETGIKLATYQRSYSWKQKRMLETKAPDDNNSKNEEKNISAQKEGSRLQTFNITDTWENKVTNTYQKPKLNKNETPKNENLVNVVTEDGEQNETTENYLLEARTKSKKNDKKKSELEIMARDFDIEEQQHNLQFLKLYRHHKCLWNMANKHTLAVRAAYADFIDHMAQWGKPGMIKTDIVYKLDRIKMTYNKEKRQVKLLKEKGYTELNVPLWYDFLEEFIENDEIDCGLFYKCRQQNRQNTTHTDKMCSDDRWKLFTKFIAEEMRKVPHAEALNLQSDIMTMVANSKRITSHGYANLNTTTLLNMEFDHSGPSTLGLHNKPNTKDDKNTSLPIVKQEKEKAINLQLDAMSLTVNRKEAIYQGCSNFNSSPSGLVAAANMEWQDDMLSKIKTEKEDNMIEIEIMVPGSSTSDLDAHETEDALPKLIKEEKL